MLTDLAQGAAEVGQLLNEACSGTEDLTLYISDAARATGRAVAPVSYTHLTLPTKA